MSKDDILDEIEELQDYIAEKMKMLSEYVEEEGDIDTELEPAFEDLEMAVSNLNDQLDNFTSAM